MAHLDFFIAGGETFLALLKCVDLTKKYGKRIVVNKASLYVKSGEIVGLLGPNGAGKTTLFSMILGLVIPNFGSIHIDDVELTHVPVFRRALMGITYLPQETSVFNGLTVGENLEIVFENLKVPMEERIKRVRKLLKDFGIFKLRDQRASLLSGGEKRRLELARMMTLNPKFILLDEPFSGIDPLTVKDIQRMILKLKSENIGIIVTDHSVSEIEKIVDRLYVIHKGEILAQGLPYEVLSNPKVIDNYIGRELLSDISKDKVDEEL